MLTWTKAMVDVDVCAQVRIREGVPTSTGTTSTITLCTPIGVPWEQTVLLFGRKYTVSIADK
jgi:hypothetical protein